MKNRLMMPALILGSGVFGAAIAVGIIQFVGNREQTAYSQGGAGATTAPTRQEAQVEIPFIPPERQTIVPNSVRERWKAVQLRIEDRQTGTMTGHVVELGSALSIPDSTLVVQVKEFLPDLTIDGPIFTTASEELKNPAVHVTVHDGERKVFDGWLFTLFPAMHPFQHERFGIFLEKALAS